MTQLHLVRSYKMTITYTKKANEFGHEYIEMLDSEKPNSISHIPMVEGNSDYQAYLKSLDEASTL